MENSKPTTIAEQRRIGPLSHRQPLPGGQRDSSTYNHTIQGSTASMPRHGPNGTADGYSSHDSGRDSNIVQPARNENGQITPRRAYQHYTARTGRDDPFFSEELYRGMLNGHPNNKHVGSMYTASQQQEIDAYYRRLLTPRPNPHFKPSVPPTPPPRLRMEPITSANGSDLDVGDIGYWNPEWSQFVNDDDAEPLLQQQNPDEASPGSPPKSPW